MIGNERMKILLTGGTGFLGSHIAELLCERGHELILIKRRISNLDKCKSFQNNVLWAEEDESDCLKKIIAFNPKIIIHCAWKGVEVNSRNDWKIQFDNLRILSQVLFIAEKISIKKIIALGSQAEYGEYSKCIDESYPINPISQYGIVKVAASYVLKSFSVLHNIDWYWLRIFSIFGERETNNWLLPLTIINMLKGSKEMDFTKGEQVYSYLYVRDFANAVSSLVEKQGKSGIYNLCASNKMTLKDILNKVKEKINPDFRLNFGALPYRSNQSMNMTGDSSLFIKNFGDFETFDFNSHLSHLIRYYKNETL